MKTKLILIFSLGFLFMQTHAQSILSTPIEWSSANYINLVTNIQESEAFTIKTTSSEIVLTHSGRSRSFIISSHTGVWNTIQTDGKLTLVVNYSGKEGIVIIERVAGQFYITIDFSKHPDGMKRKFIITKNKGE
jgi:hypothetical protein